MKFKRILTAVLAVLMLATCMSFTAGAATTTVYVSDSATAGGDGTSAGTAYDTFAEAWADVATSGGTIVLVGDTSVSTTDVVCNGDVVITAMNGGSNTGAALIINGADVKFAGGSGHVTFENLTMYNKEQHKYTYMYGLEFEFGENVKTVNNGNQSKYKPNIVTGALPTTYDTTTRNEKTFGNNIITIKSGDVNLTLGAHHAFNGGAFGHPNLNLQFLGGTASINVGFTGAWANNEYRNRLNNVNIILETAGATIYSSNVNCLAGAYQVIANNGVTPNVTLPTTSYGTITAYFLNSAEGGRVDFIYTDATTANVASYKVKTDKDFVIVDNTAIANDGTTEPKKLEYASLTAQGDGKLLTLDAAGTYNITYVNDTTDLKFYNNDGTDASQTVPVEGTETDLSALVTAPTRTGYRFAGWNTKADGTGAAIDLANFVFDEQTTAFYAIWLSTEVYVNGTASANGNGAEATPYNNFADAWNSIKDLGGKITLLGDTSVSALGAITKDITVTAASSSTVLDLAPGGSVVQITANSTGKLKFENITIKSDTNDPITFHGLAYEMGEGVTTTGTKKPSLRATTSNTRYGNYITVIRSGDFANIELGGNNTNWSAPTGTNMNLNVYGGSVGTITAGFKGYHSNTKIGDINIQLDVQPTNKQILSDYIFQMNGAYQLIANNGVDVTPKLVHWDNTNGWHNAGDLEPAGGKYVIYSAEGGRVDFIYETPDATTAKKGEYTITSTKKYAIITNLDTGVATQQDLTAAGGTTLTLTAGKYSIGYANDPATLNFFYNDGTDGKQTVLVEKTATDISASIVTPTYAGNRFLGWNTAADGTGEYIDLTHYAHDDAATTFYAIWSTFTVYVDGNAAVNGVGTEESPYNNLTDAWNALYNSDESGKTIVLSGNVELPNGLGNTKGDILITSKDGEKARLMLAKGATFNSANGNRGTVIFDDLYFQADTTESVNFGGMAYVFTQNVVTVGSYKPTLRSAVNLEKFGDNEIAIAGGTFDTIVLGNNYSSTIGGDNSNNGNINFALYGGTVRYVNVGYSLKGGHWSNNLKNVNVLLDVAPTDGIGSIAVESMSGTYQFIANNGVKTAPGMATRAGKELVPAERKYLLYSAEGGRLDFIYEADAITAVVGKFLASTDRQTVVVINRDTLEVTEFPVVAGEAEITLAPGVYDISYTGDVVAPPTPSNPEDMAGAVVSILFNKLTVSFETDGGSKVAAQQVMIGGKVAKPAIDPVKAGYKFDGWYADKDLVNKFSFLNTKVSANTTIYAKWTADAAQAIVLTIDSTDASVFGKKVTNDVAPIIRNDRTMLPARFVAESLGAKVEWFEYERKVVITSADKNTIITLFIDSATAYINGVAYTLDAPAFIENSRTYTPVRFIAEALGADVEWNAETREVTIIK